jgi:hypothetical protein
MSSVILARPSRPVEVLHNGAWVTGWLETYRRDDEGWRGMAATAPNPAPGTTVPAVRWQPAS